MALPGVAFYCDIRCKGDANVQLTGEVALVTGASRGIGKTVAQHLGQLGAYVVGTATTSAGARTISSRLKEHGHNGIGLVLDVTDVDAVEEIINTTQSDYGTVSILINNAGITRDNLLVRMSPKDWDIVLNTDLTSIYRMSRACLRAMMKARHGRIVNITSVVGSTGNAGQANYAAAKAGINGFTRALALEVGSRGITVNAVAPGFIATDMTEDLSDAQKATLLDRIPLGRLGTCEDIAEAVGFLVTPAGRYITGHTLHVNGGLYMQ